VGIYCIGIDNGLFGAVVVIDDSFSLVDWWDTPLINLGKKGKDKNEFAPAAMGDIIRGIIHKYCPNINDNRHVFAYIEQAHAMPEQGLTSTFKTGRGYGLWEGILVGSGISYDVVHAKTWTKVMLHDMPLGEPKGRSMAKCQRLYPRLPLIKPHGRKLSMDGRSDAALIATYGMMQHTGATHARANTQTRRPPARKPT